MKKRPKKPVNYDEALITYLDILGFRDLVQTAPAGSISRTIRLVREAVRPNSARAQVFEMKYQSFSDLTVISIPLLTRANIEFRPGFLSSQINGLARAQVELLEQGILLRGAITYGLIVRSYGQLFGPGLIRAYDLERSQAKYPRIIVDDRVFRELNRNPALMKRNEEAERKVIESLLVRDVDGLRFVDYISAMRDDWEISARQFRQFLKLHRGLIKQRLREFRKEPKVIEKYSWLSEYHNRTVAKLSMRDTSSLLI